MTPDLKPMPLVSTVQVLRYNAEGQPWPVATIHIDAANKVALTGDAFKAYAPLLTAAKKAASRLAHQGIAEARAGSTRAAQGCASDPIDH